MAYTLQAFIGNEADVRSVARGSLIVALSQSKAIAPLGESVRKAHGIPFLPLTDEGALELPEAVHVSAARAKKIAYVEAEFFGGEGAQAAAVWEDGKLVYGPVVASDAINQALRLLGVTKNMYFDEFEALELGRHRNTDEWK